MEYSYPEIKKFLGLFLQKNSFVVPDGAMEEARNIIIRDDDVVTKLSGFYQYYDAGLHQVSTLHSYKNTLFAVTNDELEHFNEVGTAPNLTGVKVVNSGAAVRVSSTRKSRSVQESGNFYFTTDDGILKIDAVAGKIYTAGTPPAIDLNALLNAENGPFLGNSQVAYRVVYGRKDKNDNLLLGSPSDILVLANVKQVNVAWARVTNVVTVTAGAGHNYAVGMTVEITGSSGVAPVPNGTYTITAVTMTTFSFAHTAADDTGTFDYKTSRSVTLETSIPSEIVDITDRYFYQIYRTSKSVDASTTPQPDFRLVDEQEITAQQLSDRVIFYTDNVENDLVAFAAELYTNPNSREGELQANARPPAAEDVTLYKGYVIYSSVKTRAFINLDIVDPSVITPGSWVEIKLGSVTRRYYAVSGAGNLTETSTAVSFAGAVITVTFPGHGYSVGDKVFISNAKGTGTLPMGEYTLTAVTATTFTFTIAGTPTTLISLDFQETLNALGRFVFTVDNTSASVAVRLRNTAKALVKAVNRDPLDDVYARYVSSITDVPGKIRFEAKAFDMPIQLRTDTVNSGQGYSPVLIAAYTTAVQSQDTSKPNSFYFSKVQEPEAVPIANEFTACSRNETIFRSIALKDSIMHITSGGIYRTTGDGPYNATTTVLDNTVKCVAKDSCVLLNNQIYLLSNQGVCVVTESSVRIISRKIENVISPIVGKPLINEQTSAVGYESDRTYRLSTISPNGSIKNVTYIYNFLNDTWTDSDFLFTSGVVGANDFFYQTNTINRIQRERKNQTRIDYTAQNYPVSIISTPGMSAVVNLAITPKIGDIIEKQDVFSRIVAVEAQGLNFLVTFERPTNLTPGDSQQLYQGFTSRIKFAPFHAGLVGKEKQFCQIQMHSRTFNISRLTLTFAGQIFGGSETTVWKASEVGGISTKGWGYEPWGFFPWGLVDGIFNVYATEPAPIVRIYVPRFQQRNTFIQFVVEHSEAGESLDIQALAWAVRSYGERVSK